MKMKILESLFEDEDDVDNYVKNNIDINFGSNQIPASQSSRTQHDQLPSQPTNLHSLKQQNYHLGTEHQQQVPYQQILHRHIGWWGRK